MVLGIRATGAVMRQQLHRFKAMIDFYGVAAGEVLRQVTGQSQSGHLSAVTVDVVRSPGGLDRMQIVDGKRWREESMTAIDASVEQADMGHIRAFSRESGSSQNFVHPLGLLFRAQ